jgi:hypothetical protein
MMTVEREQPRIRIHVSLPLIEQGGARERVHSHFFPCFTTVPGMLAVGSLCS